MTICKEKNLQSFGKRLVWTGSWRAPLFGRGILPGASNCSCVASTLHVSTRQISGAESVLGVRKERRPVFRMIFTIYFVYDIIYMNI